MVKNCLTGHINFGGKGSSRFQSLEHCFPDVLLKNLNQLIS